MFTDGKIDDVVVNELKKFSDDRGWLMELFRHDELAKEYYPVMTYISMTNPGVARGPHEHVDQADYFCFAGPSDFKLYLWDSRVKSATYKNRMVILAGASSPTAVIVPKGVVHAYKNVGNEGGLVINAPNRLFMGDSKAEAVDEIRHEELENSPYILD
jgi:dTDP-4-dehydrorhamnose 3,5-epimerase